MMRPLLNVFILWYRMQEIARGAEAVIMQDGDQIIKERIVKSYRLPALDQTLRKRRTRQEARLLREARRAGVAVPHVIEEADFSLTLEALPGKRVRDVLDVSSVHDLCEQIGTSIARLHSFDLIHGDLTTSNMIVQDGSSLVHFIDFGLGFHSRRPEDKAVDLHVLCEALDSTHHAIAEHAWEILLNAYQRTYSEAASVVAALTQIEKRGRYARR